MSGFTFPAFTFLIITVTFFVWLRLKMKKGYDEYKVLKKKNEDYFREDSLANDTRRTDIDESLFISLPLENLPLEKSSKKDEILKFKDAKMLHIGNMTNKELKLKYGLANLEVIAMYEEAYQRLCRLLSDYAKQLYEEGSYDDCELILRAVVKNGSDLSAPYFLLGDVCVKNSKKLHTEIDELTALVKNTSINDELKVKILNYYEKLDCEVL